MPDVIETRYGSINVLYEDNQLLIAVKPCNLPSQSDISGDEDMLSLLKRYIGRSLSRPCAPAGQARGRHDGVCQDLQGRRAP